MERDLHHGSPGVNPGACPHGQRVPLTQRKPARLLKLSAEETEELVCGQISEQRGRIVPVVVTASAASTELYLHARRDAHRYARLKMAKVKLPVLLLLLALMFKVRSA